MRRECPVGLSPGRVANHDYNPRILCKETECKLLKKHEPKKRAGVCGGVDTHRDIHVAAAIDPTGRLLGTESFPVNPAGYTQMCRWLCTHGPVVRVGGGRHRQLRRRAVTPSHQTGTGGSGGQTNPTASSADAEAKTDTVDAYAAACATARGEADATPKAADGAVEAIRNLHVGYESAVQARTSTTNQLKAVIVTAPEALRSELGGESTAALVKTCAGCRPSSGGDVAARYCKTALKNLARRYQQLKAEIGDYRTHLKRLRAQANPALLAAYGVGCETAAVLLITAGDNPDRLSSESSFAALCGASPVKASSGKIVRHRLNRGGRRQANKALRQIARTRMRLDPRTKQYADRRTEEGKTRREILRCLKRYTAREVYQLPANPHPTPDPARLRHRREQAGLTLVQVARALNTYPTRISHLETGHTHNHHLATRYEQWPKETQKTGCKTCVL